MADLTCAIEVKPLALHTGAEISGVDLGQPLDVATRKAINDALLRWKVVFFRGQHLDHRGHVAFARQMGEPTIGHAVFGHIEDFPEIYSVAKFRTAQTNRGARPQRPWTGWHTDITAALNPPKASILRGVTIPPYAATRSGPISRWPTRVSRRRCVASSTGCAASIGSRRPPVPPRARPTTRASAAGSWRPSIRSCACILRRESASCSSVRRS